jgi:hypothetical protein
MNDSNGTPDTPDDNNPFEGLTEQQIAEQIAEQIGASRDRDEEIFVSLVKDHGCGTIASVIAASGDTILDGGPKNVAFVGLRLFGMSGAVDDGSDQLATIVDPDNIWALAFAATKPQLLGLIEALQSAADYIDDIEDIRAVETPADFDAPGEA